MATKNYSPKLPLELDLKGNFINISSVLPNIKQKLKFLILTNPGEKIMDPNFGVGIKKYLFENPKNRYFLNSNDKRGLSINDDIKTSINKQVNKYCTEIQIDDIQISLEEKVLSVSIFYTFNGILEDFLEVSIEG